MKVLGDKILINTMLKNRRLSMKYSREIIILHYHCGLVVLKFECGSFLSHHPSNVYFPVKQSFVKQPFFIHL